MARLKRYRIENNITMLRAAKELGVSKSTVCRFETGAHFPRPEMLLKIRRWSKGAVTADDFLNQIGKEKA